MFSLVSNSKPNLHYFTPKRAQSGHPKRNLGQPARVGSSKHDPSRVLDLHKQWNYCKRKREESTVTVNATTQCHDTVNTMTAPGPITFHPAATCMAGIPLHVQCQIRSACRFLVGYPRLEGTCVTREIVFACFTPIKRNQASCKARRVALDCRLSELPLRAV